MSRRSIRLWLVAGMLIVFSWKLMSLPQQSIQPAGAAVPRLITVNGVLKNGDGRPFSGIIGVAFAMYRDQQGGTPLWMETQNLQLDEQGRYAVLLGATQGGGLPPELFSSSEPRWLGVQAQLPGEEEQPRILIVSVPYALKAADADTIGGKPLSAFVLNESVAPVTGSSRAKTANTGVFAVSGTGTTNQLTKWLDTNGTLGDSAVFESGGNVGIRIGTNNPAALFNVVDNGAGSGTMLLGDLNPAHFFGGLYVQGTNDGSQAGIVQFSRGDAQPNPWYLEKFIRMQHVNWSTGPVSIIGIGKKDSFAIRNFEHAGEAGPGGSNARLTILPNGAVSIGDANPNQWAFLHIQAGPHQNVVVGTQRVDEFSGGLYVQGTNDGSEGGIVQFSRSNLLTTDNPQNIQRFIKMQVEDNNALGYIGVGGAYDFQIVTGIHSPATPYVNGIPRFTVKNNGDVGIGTTAPAVKLHVKGDIRVGTSEVNGCVQAADGSALAGTCSSDARLKQNVRPFPPVLERIVQLQPVSYTWNTKEHPEYRFGAQQTSGLIAQDVEKVFPEMVSVDTHGYKAVNYSQVPLLLLQAVRELTAEKEEQRAQIQQLLSDVKELKAQLVSKTSDRK